MPAGFSDVSVFVSGCSGSFRPYPSLDTAVLFAEAAFSTMADVADEIFEV